jgi:hypothetical protein
MYRRFLFISKEYKQINSNLIEIIRFPIFLNFVPWCWLGSREFISIFFSPFMEKNIKFCYRLYLEFDDSWVWFVQDNSWVWFVPDNSWVWFVSDNSEMLGQKNIKKTLFLIDFYYLRSWVELRVIVPDNSSFIGCSRSSPDWFLSFSEMLGQKQY